MTLELNAQILDKAKKKIEESAVFLCKFFRGQYSKTVGLHGMFSSFLLSLLHTLSRAFLWTGRWDGYAFTGLYFYLILTTDEK